MDCHPEPKCTASDTVAKDTKQNKKGNLTIGSLKIEIFLCFFTESIKHNNPIINNMNNFDLILKVINICLIVFIVRQYVIKLMAYLQTKAPTHTEAIAEAPKQTEAQTQTEEEEVKEEEEEVKEEEEEVKEEEEEVKENNKNTWYTIEDGKSRYKGEWKNGLPNGKGIKHFYKTNSVIEGNFVDSFAEGFCKQTFEQTWEKMVPYYEGEFKRNTYNGKGEYHYGDGDYYKGEWKDGLCHGQGLEYSERTNRTWVGEYYKDKKIEGEWYRGEFYRGHLKNSIAK